MSRSAAGIKCAEKMKLLGIHRKNRDERTEAANRKSHVLPFPTTCPHCEYSSSNIVPDGRRDQMRCVVCGHRFLFG
jgi:transcription elongation factor Elf1